VSERAYIIFCDESDASGRYYSNFYGGVIIGGSQYERVTAKLNAQKRRLNFLGEVKWAKVSEAYLAKYQELVLTFFKEIQAGHVRVRIMFRQNAHQPVGLNQSQIDGGYFRLYYQFIKHAFGLAFHPPSGCPVSLKLYFDEFPETREAATQFKGHILGLKDNPKIHQAGFTLVPEDIAEIRSHDHVLAHWKFNRPFTQGTLDRTLCSLEVCPYSGEIPCRPDETKKEKWPHPTYINL
jgi:hypothetical protein